MTSTKWKHLRNSSFSANTGLRVAKGRDLAQSSGEKNSKCKGKDYQNIYRNDHCRSTERTQQNASPSATSFWFSVKGFVTIITAFLRTVKHCSLNHGGHREGNCGDGLSVNLVVERRSEYLGVYTRESLRSTVIYLKWRHSMWLSVLVCDWVVVCQESLFVLAPTLWVCTSGCVYVWVHVEVRLWCVNLTLLIPRAISPQPSSTIILIDPHLLRMAP